MTKQLEPHISDIVTALDKTNFKKSDKIAFAYDICDELYFILPTAKHIHKLTSFIKIARNEASQAKKKLHKFESTIMLFRTTSTSFSLNKILTPNCDLKGVLKYLELFDDAIKSFRPKTKVTKSITGQKITEMLAKKYFIHFLKLPSTGKDITTVSGKKRITPFDTLCETFSKVSGSNITYDMRRKAIARLKHPPR